MAHHYLKYKGTKNKHTVLINQNQEIKYFIKMELENFKNEKFILSSEEMGKLVGGETVKTGTKEGQLKPEESGMGWAYSYSSDCTTTTDGKSSTTYYKDDYDSCVEKPENRCDDPCDLAKQYSITKNGAPAGTLILIPSPLDVMASRVSVAVSARLDSFYL